MLNILYLIFFFLCVVNSQYIITSQSYNKVITYTYQHMQNALNKNLIEKLSLMEISDFTIGDIKVSNIKATSVNALLTGTYGDMSKQLFIISPNKIVLHFAFSYTKGEKTSENVELVFSIYLIKLRLSRENNQPVFDVMIQTKEKDYKIYGIDREDSSQIEKGFYENYLKKEEGKESIIESISTHMKNVFEAYYKNLYANRNNETIKLTKFLGENEYTLNLKTFMGFCADPENKIKAGICYSDGNILGTSVEGLEEDPMFETKFKNPGDNYYTFINYGLFNDTLQDKVLNVELTKETFSDLSFGFSVKELKSVFNITEEYADEDECTFKADLKQITFTEGQRVFTQIDAKLLIKGTETGIEFTALTFHDITTKMISNLKFNLCIENGIVISIFFDEKQVIDEDKLKEMIEEVMYKPSREKVCLTENGFNMKEYYRYINNIIVGDRGIFIEGKHLYF